MKNYFKTIIYAALASMAFGGTAQAQTPTKQDWGDFKLWIDPGHSGRENSGLYSYTWPLAISALNTPLPTKPLSA